MRLALILLALLASGGCISSTPIVQGTATLDGQLIDGGTILLIPLPGTAGTTVGGPIVAGQYKLSGPAAPVPGKHRVEVRWVRKTGRQVPVPTDPKGPGRIDEIDETIPAKYNQASTLEITVQAGINQHNLVLTSQ